MNFTINHELAQNHYTLEVFCDYLEENATPTCDRNLYLFLRSWQHEERGFSNSVDCKDGDGFGVVYGTHGGDGFGYGNGYGFSFGYSNGTGDGYGNGNIYGNGFGFGNGYGYGYGYGDIYGTGYGDGDEGNRY
jgi:hypothetical protein